MRQPPPNNIYLIGFMGAGKSTIGPLVAKALGWKFIDTDTLMVELAGQSIPQLFAVEKEAGFRKWENKAVTRVVQEKSCVVALGGGALIDRGNRALVAKSGVLIYLKAEVATLAARIEGSDRPLMKGYQGDALLSHISAVLAEREPVYKIASLQIDTGGRSPEVCAVDILREVASWKK